MATDIRKTRKAIPDLPGAFELTVSAEGVAPVRLISQRIDDITYVGTDMADLEGARQNAQQFIDSGGEELADPSLGDRARVAMLNFMARVSPEETLEFA